MRSFFLTLLEKLLLLENLLQHLSLEALRNSTVFVLYSSENLVVLFNHPYIDDVTLYFHTCKGVLKYRLFDDHRNQKLPSTRGVDRS